ncbi:DUF3347 domain-containing protein [Limibacter armeniacum]|uniref:DUF3347 domain-containing protein n=1 Tax=Limibacter armeniacum TaxID=466084 RepID=UPI002FE6A92E
MKTLFQTVLTAGIMVGTIACNTQTSDKQDHSAHNHSESMLHSTSENTIVSDDPLAAYLSIKDALVESDGEKANTAAKQLVNAIQEMEGELAQKILFDAEHIAETKDVKHQRDHFNTLSNHIYEIAKGASSKVTLYQQYCPMAMNNKGAYWLSTSKEIKNPYFGASMLTCGTVKETIQ